jgi:N6-adenosine-specific RNA methylase IME4
MSLVTEFLALRPSGGFQLIMADPPWPTEMRSEKGYAKSPEAHYETMPVAAIAAMPVELLAGANCLLWLWARNIQLPEALQVMAAWGFEYRTAGHWVKLTPYGKVVMGTGYILRSAGEPFLIGVRGAPQTTRTVRSVIHGLRREHSRKPEEAYRAAEELMPHAQRLDLFSRQVRPGWANWGRERTKFEVVA